MTELATTYSAELVGGPSLSEQIEYSKALAAGSLLPDGYRGQPANVLIAIGLGQAMGLSPAESLYRIHVIKGKPSASAELIASNVRRAGHRLRVSVTEDPPSATCTIVRADDPEPTTITRDMAWAARMGLTGEPNYKRQPATMLSWRAISACARLACPEALYGVAYTPDEVTDAPRVQVTQEPAPAADRMRAMLGQREEPEPEPDGVTAAQLKKLGAAMAQRGMDRTAALRFVSFVVGREVGSRADLSKQEASDVIQALEAGIAAPDDTSGPQPEGDPQ